MMEKYTIRLNFPYLIGVYLAVNAIPDAYLLVDGPDCAFFKSGYIQGKHDWQSTLFDCYGFHRVTFTDASGSNISKNRDEAIKNKIKRVDEFEKSGIILLTSLPMATIVGIQYERIINELKTCLNKPIIEIPSKSLLGDWLDGYAETLNAIACNIELSGGKPEKDNVAIVGYFMDRLEEDHNSNLLELKRILNALSLKLVSVWLSNTCYWNLKDIKNAGTIISFPYGRTAAKNVAKRIGAQLIETSLPFGLKNTKNWIMQISKVFKREKKAKQFIDKEMRSLIPKLEWVIPHVFLNKRLMYVGDPHLLIVFLQFVEELGCKVVVSVVVAEKKHFEPKHIKGKFDLRLTYFEPRKGEFKQILDKARKCNVNLVVGNSLCHEKDINVMEFGFPSYYSHSLFENPFFGFRGALSFINRMVNNLESGKLKME